MSPDEMRRLADLVRSKRRPPGGDQTPVEYHASIAVQAVADGLLDLADELDPPKPPPFDIAAARLDNAALGAEIRTMRGAA